MVIGRGARRARALTAVAVLAATLVPAIPTLPAAPAAAVVACDDTGIGCAVGMTGPRGGVVFYDAGSQQWWGRYLEANMATVSFDVPWGASTDSIYATLPQLRDDVAMRRAYQRDAMRIGMGYTNTSMMLLAGSPLARAVSATNRGTWWIPSKDELDALYHAWRSGRVPGSWAEAPMWTSTESEDAYAWYQLFQDGTQFTDANGIVAKYPTNKTVTVSPRHVGSDFASAPMHVVMVRAFPAAVDIVPPTPTPVTAARVNAACATRAIDCAVGDVGPAGGIVVYDAGSDQAWGRWLEVAPQSCESKGLAFAKGPGLVSPLIGPLVRLLGKAIGTGAANTTRLAGRRSNVVYAGVEAASAAWLSTCNGYDDWFLPSKDELNEACRVLSHSRTGRQLTPVGGFDRGYYWTSSDYNGRTAWAQYFADCQQFDRVQTLRGNAAGAQRPFLVRPMRAFKTGGVRP